MWILTFQFSEEQSFEVNTVCGKGENEIEMVLPQI